MLYIYFSVNPKSGLLDFGFIQRPTGNTTVAMIVYKRFVAAVVVSARTLKVTEIESCT